MDQSGVFIENAVGTTNEYMVLDSSKITIGRFFMCEFDEINKHCILRVNFYRDNSNGLLSNALKIMLKKIFTDTTIVKVNIYVDEEVDVSAFTIMGFVLEGIVENAIFYKGESRSELLFGIIRRDFEKNQVINILKLRGDRIYIKILTPEDSENVLDYYIRNKKHLAPFETLRDEGFYKLNTQRRILIESYRQFINGNAISCGIFKGDRIIGKIQLSNIVMGIFRSGIIGYSMDSDEQGKGYMKEALKLMLSYAFDDMELHRIEASTLLDNTRSQNLLIGCGFEECGINKKYLYINGAWRDHKTFYKIF